MSDDAKYVSVSSRRVEFEDGQILDVVGFSIARDLVTVGEFIEFVRATGYRTCAEQQGAGEAYLNNELVEHVDDQDELHLQPAYCMSAEDALAFTDWAGLRLPTEAEWLAAALISNELVSHKQRYQTGNLRGPDDY